MVISAVVMVFMFSYERHIFIKKTSFPVEIHFVKIEFISKELVAWSFFHLLALCNIVYPNVVRFKLSLRPVGCQRLAPLGLPIFRRTLFVKFL